MPADPHDIIRNMHGAAGDYYRHFSISRTTVSSLFVPIGILISVSMLTTCQASKIPIWTAVAIVGFVVVTTLFLNMIFAKWSSFSRELEKYYEKLLQNTAITYVPEEHGFRYLFRKLTKSERVHGIPDYNPKSLRNYFDFFVSSIVIFGLIYLVGYYFLFSAACYVAPSTVTGLHGP